MFYYFNGPIKICEKGEGILEAIEKKIEEQQDVIEELIGKIKIVEDSVIPNTVFNYINVVIEDQDQLDSMKSMSVTPIMTPKRMRTEECKMGLDISSEKILKSPDSPNSRNRRSISGERTWDNKHSRSVLKRRNSKVEEPQEQVDVEEVVTEFCQKQMETLDLSGQMLLDYEILEVLKFIKSRKKIKGLKLIKNKLTTDGLTKMLDQIPSITNLNLSYNNLTDDAISQLLSQSNKVPNLRIVNLSNNKINERRSKNIIDCLKKQGVIVTL